MSDGKGRIFINIEDKNAIDVVDTKTWKVVATWTIEPCDGPTGIAMDRDDEPHLLRLQQEVGRRRRGDRQGRRRRSRTATASTRSAGISRRS